MIDPRTGEERTAQRGSPARLRRISRQNMQTADMAEPGGVIVAVKTTQDGDAPFVRSLRRMSANQAERNEVLRRAKRKNARLG